MAAPFPEFTQERERGKEVLRCASHEFRDGVLR